MPDAHTVHGGAEAHAKILKWLRPYAESREREGVVQLRLLQLASLRHDEDVPPEIIDDDLVFDPSEDLPLESFVERIVDAATEDCETHKRGTVRYAVQIKGREDRRSFSLENRPPKRDYSDAAEEFFDPDDTTNEPPTPKGQIALAQDFAYKAIKLAFSEIAEGRSIDRDERRDLRKENAELRKAFAEGIRVKEIALSKADERRILLEKHEKSMKRTDALFDMVGKIGGAVLLQKLGGGQLPLGMLFGAGGMGGMGGPPGGPPSSTPRPPPAPAAPPVSPSYGGSPPSDSGSFAGPKEEADPSRAYDRPTAERVDSLLAKMDMDCVRRLNESDLLTDAMKEDLFALFRLRLEARAATEGNASIQEPEPEPSPPEASPPRPDPEPPPRRGGRSKKNGSASASEPR